MSGTNFVFMSFLFEAIHGSVKVCVCEPTILTLVKLGQMTHLSTSNGKLLNSKLLELINIQTFYIDHFSIWESLCKQYSPNLESHTNFIEQYVGSVDFELHFASTLSNAKMVYI